MNSSINPSLALTDPKYIGPGMWYDIHLKAYEATDNQKINDFIEHMNLLAEKFPCKACRNHINEYMNTHPFDDLKYLENKDGRKIGMFKWAWLFHNAVNTRLHKPLVDWETAWSMYDEEPTVCSKNCESESDHNDNNENNTNDSNDNENNDDNDDNDSEQINELPVDSRTKKEKLAQAYFMKIGIPDTLRKHGILDLNEHVSLAT